MIFLLSSFSSFLDFCCTILLGLGLSAEITFSRSPKLYFPHIDIDNDNDNDNESQLYSIP